MCGRHARGPALTSLAHIKAYLSLAHRTQFPNLAGTSPASVHVTSQPGGTHSAGHTATISFLHSRRMCGGPAGPRDVLSMPHAGHCRAAAAAEQQECGSSAGVPAAARTGPPGRLVPAWPGCWPVLTARRLASSLVHWGKRMQLRVPPRGAAVRTCIMGMHNWPWLDWMRGLRQPQLIKQAPHVRQPLLSWDRSMLRPPAHTRRVSYVASVGSWAVVPSPGAGKDGEQHPKREGQGGWWPRKGQRRAQRNHWLQTDEGPPVANR